jgi:TPR repeat protein
MENEKKLCIFRKQYKSGEYSNLVERYKSDIESGNEESRVKLAWLLLHGRECVPAENHTAFELINSIHIEHSPDIIGIRAFLFLIGIKCVRNERKAFKLAKYSAKQDSAYGYLVVGMLYHWGGAGLDKDDKLAMDNFKKAADLNLDMGYYMLGALYAISENYEKSFYFYMLAANHGQPDACYDVGRCYEYVIGVSLNIENAILWYNRAYISGRVDALSHLEDLS